MQLSAETIVAISTPAGRGGIGIVRLSGLTAKSIAESIVKLKRPLEASHARFGHVMDAESSAVLDEAVVTWFQAPRSYTGEDVVEIAMHGSPVLLDAIMRRCIAAGARLAAPGEFTERAFLAGRIDLTQAEAVDDLIQATTLQQARTAARQLGGGLSRKIKPIKEQLVELIAAMEAGIDFAEDDLDSILNTQIMQALQQIEPPLAAMETSFAYGRMLREGFRLAIVGRPNAGKSSLFNQLLRRDRAIVTAQPGTTRDLVAERLEFVGIPVEIIDTAGLRDALDEAEMMGVARSREAMAEADVVLLVVAADATLHEEDLAVVRVSCQSSTGLVIAVNKVDVLDSATVAHRLQQELTAAYLDQSLSLACVETSALKGTGIEDLRVAVFRALNAIAPGADAAPVTSLRQQHAIAAAATGVRAANEGVLRGVPHEMMLIDLHEALAALDALTGTTHTEEILGLIFSRFCVGK